MNKENNKKKEQPFQKPFKVCKNIGMIFDANDMHVLDVRGWGRLTGTGGGLGISGIKAAALQDAFKQRVVDALNAYEEPSEG